MTSHLLALAVPLVVDLRIRQCQVYQLLAFQGRGQLENISVTFLFELVDLTFGELYHSRFAFLELVYT